VIVPQNQLGKKDEVEDAVAVAASAMLKITGMRSHAASSTTGRLPVRLLMRRDQPGLHVSNGTTAQPTWLAMNPEQR